MFAGTVLLAWIVVAIYRIAMNITSFRAMPERHFGPVTIAYLFADAVLWTLLSFGLFALAERFPAHKLRWLTALTVIGPALLLTSSAYLVLVSMLSSLTLNISSPWTVIAGDYMLIMYHRALLDSAIVLMIAYGMQYKRAADERELRASRLETDLARAQVEVLRAQMQPHFLFNALHSISTMLRRDPDGAERMISRLGELLRMSIAGGNTQEVMLVEELDFVRQYVEIEQVRFADRLTVEWKVPEDVLETQVPSLILQPLVENSIQHGIGGADSAIHIIIAAHANNGTLTLEVSDDGVGLHGAESFGIGLGHTRARLEQRFGERASLRLAERAGGGTLVTVQLPRYA